MVVVVVFFIDFFVIEQRWHFLSRCGGERVCECVGGRRGERVCRVWRVSADVVQVLARGEGQLRARVREEERDFGTTQVSVVSSLSKMTCITEDSQIDQNYSERTHDKHSSTLLIFEVLHLVRLLYHIHLVDLHKSISVIIDRYEYYLCISR